jgi:hypothetical protein
MPAGATRRADKMQCNQTSPLLQHFFILFWRESWNRTAIYILHMPFQHTFWQESMKQNLSGCLTIAPPSLTQTENTTSGPSEQSQSLNRVHHSKEMIAISSLVTTRSITKKWQTRERKKLIFHQSLKNSILQSSNVALCNRLDVITLKYVHIRVTVSE